MPSLRLSIPAGMRLPDELDLAALDQRIQVALGRALRNAEFPLQIRAAKRPAPAQMPQDPFLPLE